MKEIPLTQGKVALVDDADFEAVMQFKWHAVKADKNVYAARTVRKPDGTWRKQYLHQFLMPGAERIDHKDGNGLNDQRDNLRPCTHAQNIQNSRKHINVTSKHKGVSFSRQMSKWRVDIAFKGKQHYLGLFNLEEDAARAYDSAARKQHKEFARLNFP